MADINKRKPRVINLKKKKLVVPVVTPVKLEVAPEVKPEIKAVPIVPRIVEQVQCSQCGGGNEDMLRCLSCETSHQELVARLDAVKRVKVPKVKEPLMVTHEKRGGIDVTVYTDRATAQIAGIPWKPNN